MSAPIQFKIGSFCEGLSTVTPFKKSKTDLLKPKGFNPCPAHTYIVAYEQFSLSFFYFLFIGEVLGFENLVFSVFEFIHGLIETPKFKKTVKKFLDELIYFLVLYMQITEDQVRIVLLKYCMTLSPVSQDYAGAGVKREGRGGFKATENADSIVNQKELLVIAILYTSALCDWMKNLSLIPSQPEETKTYRELLALFPALGSGCMYSVISQPIRRKENISRLSRTFSRACQWLHVFASRSDCLI